MPSILSFGELLVEIMRPDLDQPLNESHPFVGPFASGAPAIFADAVAKLGLQSRLLACAGDDAFGHCCLEKLRQDGVETSFIHKTKNKTTGIAFVSYKKDGSRDFLFHLKDSAAAELRPEHVTADLLEGVDCLHINGSSLLISPEMLATGLELIKQAKARDILISFDPNIRAELIQGNTDWLKTIVTASNIIMPSGDEACFLTGIADAKKACLNLLEQGTSLVVHKQGALGSTVYWSDSVLKIASLEVQEVDPTGAGDAFAAGFLAYYLKTQDALSAAAFANGVGGLATTKLGPMEALPSLALAEQQFERWKQSYENQLSVFDV